jgi:hypothetical protein
MKSPVVLCSAFALLTLSVSWGARAQAAGAVEAVPDLAWPQQQTQRPAPQPPPPTPKDELVRLRSYHDRIGSTLRSLPNGASLAVLLKPVLQLAGTRGAAGNVLDENRAGLLVLAFYINGWPLDRVVPEAREWPRLEGRTVLLRGRGDLTQHFTVSALIAAAAGERIADLAGVYKELEDARHGSGFSFSDLAADRAGTRLGQMATDSVESAHRLLSRMTTDLTEADMMPEVTDLPDNLPQAEFTRRFGRVGAPAYNEMVGEIERRLAGLSLFQ